jgi:MFS family permease
MSTLEKLAGVRLTPSVRRRNMAWYFVVLWFSSMYLGVMNANQPFVLAEYLKIPLDQHGQVSGIIQACAEVVMIATVSLAGVLSDRLGRPIVYASGFVLAALGVALYTHATSLPTLILYRVIFTVGAAAITAMLVTVLTDYVVDDDRGRANGYQGFIAGAGAIFTFFFLTALPSILRKNLQVTPGEAGHLAYYIIAVFGLLAGGIAWARLARYLPPQAARDDRPLSALAAEAIGAARRDPGIALAYAASFVSRGDLAVAGVFITTWINRHMILHGATTDMALRKAGAIGGLAPLAATLAAPLWGLLADRMSRVTALAIILGLAVIAYGSVFFVDDPTSPRMMGIVALIGVVEIGGFVASQALIGQQAPAGIRGSVIGFFGLSGAVGILVGTLVGGILTARVGEWAPFVMFAGFNLIVALWALRLRGRLAATPAPALAAD